MREYVQITLHATPENTLIDIVVVVVSRVTTGW